MGKLRVLILLVLLGLLLAAAGWFWISRQIAPVSADQTTQVFVIKKGQSVDSIGQALQKAGLIRSPLMFKVIVTQKRLAKKIQAGSFRLSPSLSTGAMAEALTHGTLDVWVTVLEGWRREEIAAAIAKAYGEAGTAFNEQKFLTLTAGQEGYLFPDTYLMPLGATEEAVVNILTGTFEKRVKTGLATEISQSGKPLADIVTLASLVEREAKTDQSRQMVAGILWKRLAADWPLQVDATLQYAVGYNAAQKTWWVPPTAVDKAVNSAYNTYATTGLPPAPICSPSLSSIKAVLNPTSSEYWFYLTGTDNQMHYAKTIEEHNQNIAAYLR